MAFYFHLVFIFDKGSELLSIVCALKFYAFERCSVAAPMQGVAYAQARHTPLLSTATSRFVSPFATGSHFWYSSLRSSVPVLYPAHYAVRCFLRSRIFHYVPPLHIPLCREPAAAACGFAIIFVWQTAKEDEVKQRKFCLAITALSGGTCWMGYSPKGL